MEDMASYYLEAVRTVSSETPLFMGHSSGAFIAYEMALQLQEEGHIVPLLIIIDSGAPFGPLDELMQAFHSSDLYESLEALYLCAWAVSLVYAKPLPFTAEKLASLSIAERNKVVAMYFIDAGFLPNNAPIDMVKTVLQMLASHTKADAAYHEKNTMHNPMPLFKGEVLLFRCSEETNWPGYDIVSSVDKSPYSNWDKFCEGPIEVVEVPGANHITIVIDPCIKYIAEVVQRKLDTLAC